MCSSEKWPLMLCCTPLALALFAVTPAFAQTSGIAPNAGTSVAPSQILRADWEDNAAEMQLALNAQKVGHSPAVMAYARLVVVDANAIQQTLLPSMKRRGVEVSAQMVNGAATRITAKTGTDFDLAYLAAQIVHLQDDLTRFRGEQTSNDKDVQEIANKMLPVVQQHLSLAEAVRTWLGAGQPNGLAAQ